MLIKKTFFITSSSFISHWKQKFKCIAFWVSSAHCQTSENLMHTENVHVSHIFNMIYCRNGKSSMLVCDSTAQPDSLIDYSMPAAAFLNNSSVFHSSSAWCHLLCNIAFISPDCLLSFIYSGTGVKHGYSVSCANISWSR